MLLFFIMMLLFSKRNLLFPDYVWTRYEKNDPRIAGKPDDTVFERSEGNQVVYLINKLMSIWHYRFVNTGNKMERLIRDKMPEELRTQEAAQQWLQDNLRL